MDFEKLICGLKGSATTLPSYKRAQPRRNSAGVEQPNLHVPSMTLC